MDIKLNRDEMAMLTAIIIAIGEDVENGLFDQGDIEMKERAKKSFLSLSNKVLMANFELISEQAEMSEDVMDAEILEEK